MIDIDTSKKMPIEKWQFLVFGILVVLIALVAVRINLRFWSLDTVGSDTYYSWVEGRRILDGQNPYERILHGNMEENKKYSTYFPLFYEASALVQRLGIRQYRAWIDWWRYVFLACNIAIGFALYGYTFVPKKWALSILGVLFWYFNRWTLSASEGVVLDFIPIFLMVLSLGMFTKYRKASFLLYGLSLAVKQIAVFLLPLYLIWEYQETRSVGKTVLAGCLIALFPIVSSMPFLIWNFEGFIRSIAFSATRDSLNHFGADSIDSVLNLSGLVGRVPFMIMLFAAYFAAWQNAIGKYSAAMIAISIFVAFNSVLFTHYPTWLMPLLPLAASEWLHFKVG